MKVSIITVCLNSACTIEQTIKSVLNQTYKDIEYIIVDGESTDGTQDIIKKYQKYIAKYVSEPDRGLYDAMNKGIRMSSGDVIGIINSDDWYDLQTVEKVVRLFQENAADVVYGDELLIYESGVEQRRVTGPITDLVCRMNLSHPTVFVKRELYEKFGVFDRRYKIAADYDFLLRLYRKGVKMVECPEILAYFRMGGLSIKNGVLCADETKAIATKYLEQDEREACLPIIEKEHKFRIKRCYTQETMRKILNFSECIDIKELILKNVKNAERVYIFGAGDIGREVYEFLCGINLKIEGFLDNSEKKIGKEYLKKTVQRTVDVRNKSPFIIIAVLFHQEEIRRQLCAEGYIEDEDFCIYADFIEHVKNMLV